MKRKSYEDVKRTFEENGCTLLSDNYINAKSPLEYICSCGNPSTTTYDVMRKGHKCNKCGTQRGSDKKRIPYSEIKKSFEEKDCVLLTKENEYNNIKDRVNYICSCGNEAIVIAEAFYYAGQIGCMKCAHVRRGDQYMLLHGVDNPMRIKEIKEKSLKTAYGNGTVPTSSQQFYIHGIVGGELNYPVNTSVLDMAFPDSKVYLEYNGGLHDGQVKFGHKTQREFDEHEKRRRYALFRLDWKEIRIVSKKDRLPRENKIREMIEFANEYLVNHHWIEFNIDNNTVSSSQFNKTYDFDDTFIFRKDKHSKLIKSNISI